MCTRKAAWALSPRPRRPRGSGRPTAACPTAPSSRSSPRPWLKGRERKGSIGGRAALVDCCSREVQAPWLLQSNKAYFDKLLLKYSNALMLCPFSRYHPLATHIHFRHSGFFLFFWRPGSGPLYLTYFKVVVRHVVHDRIEDGAAPGLHEEKEERRRILCTLGEAVQGAVF